MSSHPTSYRFPSFIDELQARVAIEDALKRYCRAVDRCDWDLLRSVYHDDALLDHGDYKGPVEGFIDWVRERRRWMVHTAHFIANIQVDFWAADGAVVETYGMATQRYARPAPLVQGGAAEARVQSVYRYVDEFERRGGVWRIARATLVAGDLAVEQLTEPVTFPPHRAVQRPDGDDVLYRLLAERIDA